jgi:hypothetical protein
LRVKNHLRSHVFIGSAESASFCVDIFRSPSEVTELNVPVLINEYILRFDIPVNYIVDMQVFNGFDSLYEINEGLWFRELILCVLVIKEIASFHIIEDHVQVFLIYNGVPQSRNVWMQNLTVQLYLPFNQFNLML